MNKMHTIQDVKQRIHELIQKEIAKCNKEIGKRGKTVCSRH